MYWRVSHVFIKHSIIPSLIVHIIFIYLVILVLKEMKEENCTKIRLVFKIRLNQMTLADE